MFPNVSCRTLTLYAAFYMDRFVQFMTTTRRSKQFKCGHGALNRVLKTERPSESQDWKQRCLYSEIRCTSCMVKQILEWLVCPSQASLRQVLKWGEVLLHGALIYRIRIKIRLEIVIFLMLLKIASLVSQIQDRNRNRMFEHTGVPFYLGSYGIRLVLDGISCVAIWAWR